MSLKLENYLRNERENLDVELPDDSTVWQGIERGMKARGKRNTDRIGLVRFRNIAAAAIILFSAGYIANDIIHSITGRQTMTLSSFDGKLGIREDEYRATVSLLSGEVKSLSGSSDPVMSELFRELKKLDALYNESVTDLKELGATDKIINTIFNIYEQKIRLLELIILETKRTQNHENNEKINL